MSNARDDVVIRPRLQPAGASTPVRERSEAVVRQVRERRQSLLRALAKRALKMRVLRAAARTAGMRLPGGSGAALRKLGVWAVPVVFGLGIARVISGRSFEGMQEDVQQWALGEADDFAAGAKDAREFLMQDGVAGYIAPNHARVIFGRRFQHFARMETARQGFMQDRAYQSDGPLDIAALRAAEAAKSAAKAIADKIASLLR